jgi:hypothetical protein
LTRRLHFEFKTARRRNFLHPKRRQLLTAGGDEARQPVFGAATIRKAPRMNDVEAAGRAETATKLETESK